MTKQEASEYYQVYAELEAAAEAFYQAASKMSNLVPALDKHIGTVCDEVNAFVIAADTELDEVLG